MKAAHQNPRWSQYLSHCLRACPDYSIKDIPDRFRQPSGRDSSELGALKLPRAWSLETTSLRQGEKTLEDAGGQDMPCLLERQLCSPTRHGGPKTHTRADSSERLYSGFVVFSLTNLKWRDMQSQKSGCRALFSLQWSGVRVVLD